MTDSVFSGIETAARLPQVEDLIGRVPAWTHASVSQIKRAAECPSAWYLESVLHLPRKSTAATKLGGDTHAELELYLETGAAPGALASSGLVHLPVPPVPAECVEVSFALVSAELAVPIVGFIDLVDPDRPRTIVDHKTTSSISKYGKSEEELRVDVQAIVYALASAPMFDALDNGTELAPLPDYHAPARGDREAEVYPRVRLDLEAVDRLREGITFRHVYYETRKPYRSEVSSVLLSPEDLRAGWSEIVESVLRMQAAARLPSVSEVPHSLDACSKYGGCHYRQLCAGLGRSTMGLASPFFVTASGTPSPQGSSPMSLLEALAKRKAAQAAAAAPPAVVEAAPVVVEAAPVVVEAAPVVVEAAPPTVNPPDGLPQGEPLPEVLASIAEDLKDPVVPLALPVSEEFRGVRLRSIKKDRMIPLFVELRDLVAKAGLVPPADRAHMFRAPAEGLPEAKRTAIRDACDVAIAILLGRPIPARSAAEELPLIPSTPPDFIRVAAPAPAVVAPTLEGLVDEASLRAAPVEVPVETLPAPVVEVPVETLPAPVVEAAPAVVEAGTIRAARTLYVDCVPRSREVTYLSAWIAHLCDEAARELGVPHYRAAQYKRGEDNVVTRLAVHLRSGVMVLPERLVVETRLPLSGVCLELLAPMFDTVVERMS